MILMGFLLLTSFAVWETTEQRPGTLDELRTLGAVFVSIVIYGGVSVLLLA
jgi:hypothetical protein